MPRLLHTWKRRGPVGLSARGWPLRRPAFWGVQGVDRWADWGFPLTPTSPKEAV